MKFMDKNTFTHVPIIQNDKMVGIFSENTLLSYLVDSGETIITKDMTISDLRQFLPLSAHRGEVFAFLPRKVLLAQVYEEFNKAIKKRERIGMLFITEHGREEEKLLGIITAWDLATPESETVL
jgi:CBS domain-containing protein